MFRFDRSGFLSADEMAANPPSTPVSRPDRRVVSREPSTVGAPPPSSPIPVPPPDQKISSSETKPDDAPAQPLPAAHGIRLVSRGDLTPTWGIVVRWADYFMMDGLPTGVLEARKQIEYRDVWHSPTGSMVQFTMDSPKGWITTPYLISPTNLHLFTGPVSGLSAEDTQAVMDHYALNGHETAGGHPASRPLPPGVRLVSQGGVAPAWGIVQKQANRYSPDGMRTGRIEAGTFIRCLGTTSSSKGPMAVCLPETLGQAPGAKTLVSVSDLLLFTGSPQSLSDRQRQALRTYYEVDSQITLRRNDLLQAASAKNPHFAAYQTAYQKLTAHIANSRKAVYHRDHAAGGVARVQAQERLYAAQMEEKRLQMALDEAQQKFTAWRSEHADELAMPEQDEAIMKLSEQKRTLSAVLADFGL